MKDKLPMIIGAVTVALFAVLASLQGCDIRSQLKVKAPSDMLAAIDVEEPLTLDEAEAAWEDWSAWVDSRTRAYQRAVADAEDRYARIEALIDLGLTAAEQGGASLPGGAFLVGGLSLLTGLVLKRPGEDKRVASEKEDSYNAGLAKGKALAAGETEKPA
jgi:hypothetical protein